MDVWNYENEPIEITFFIRSDDPVRKAIGEILSSELEEIGFKVKKEFGDLNKAYVVVYGSNPVEQKWSLYTEGWGSSGFTRYDSVTLLPRCILHGFQVCLETIIHQTGIMKMKN